MNPTTRFSSRVLDYVAARPSYPGEAVDHILRGIDAHEVADIGAGTGIFSRLLADRGLQVFAVEPNADMLAAGEDNPAIRRVHGSAEATTLPTDSIDLVTAAQAYHWFNPEPALLEFHRILKPSGRLALVWNQRDTDDPLTRGYIDAILEVGGEHPAETMPFDEAAVSRGGLFEPLQLAIYPNTHRVTPEGLIARARSASYCPQKGEPYERLREILLALASEHAESDGMVTMRYTTLVYLSHAKR